jgi:hypothetical protein
MQHDRAETMGFFVAIWRESGLWRALVWWVKPCRFIGHKTAKVADYPHLNTPATGAKEIHQCKRCKKKIVKAA